MIYMCSPNVHRIDSIANIHSILANPRPDILIDPNLVNAWGIVTTHKHIWVTANGKDLLIRYDLSGHNPRYIAFYDETGILLSNNVSPVVRPTGIIKNAPIGYFITDGAVTRSSFLLIASESGDIFGYNRHVGLGYKAYRIYTGSKLPISPVYKGLGMTDKYLFAADFLNGNIDVFSDIRNTNSIHFHSHISRYNINGPNHPAPFNIVDMHDKLFVLYAYKNNATDVDDNGKGGFIDIHQVNGTMIGRFSSDPSLKSPWGMIRTPEALCHGTRSYSVSNFGSGQITIYNNFGNQIGRVQAIESGLPLIIDKLWGIVEKEKQVYFSSGPNEEKNGLIGYLSTRHHTICNYDPRESCQTISSHTVNHHPPMESCETISSYTGYPHTPQSKSQKPGVSVNVSEPDPVPCPESPSGISNNSVSSNSTESDNETENCHISITHIGF
jgi:uncharacterized protein (TIGR03118 family)